MSSISKLHWIPMYTSRCFAAADELDENHVRIEAFSYQLLNRIRVLCGLLLAWGYHSRRMCVAIITLARFIICIQACLHRQFKLVGHTNLISWRIIVIGVTLQPTDKNVTVSNSEDARTVSIQWIYNDCCVSEHQGVSYSTHLRSGRWPFKGWSHRNIHSGW